MDASDIAGALAASGIDPPDGRALEALATHLELLFVWNRRMNLTAIRDPDAAISRHVAESLCALSVLPPSSAGARQLVDLGSGNGYPALPLLTCRTDLHGTLVEASEKKAAFLRAVLRKTSLGERVRVLCRRVSRGAEIPKPCDIVTLRAFPDPEGWIRSALDVAAARSVVAWLSRADATRIAGRLDAGNRRVETIDLSTRESGMILAIHQDR